MRTLKIFLLLMSISSGIMNSVYSQVLNTYPAIGTGNGRVGIGPSTGALTPAPDDLLHIHGWFAQTIGLSTIPPVYFEPALRISLEDNDPVFTAFNNMSHTFAPGGACGYISSIYGQLAMQNQGSIGTTNTRVYSSFAKKYDLVLCTSYPTDPFLIKPTVGVGEEPGMPFTFDLILTTKNPKAAIRFGTTPSVLSAGSCIDNLMPPGNIPKDVERMTILNNGHVGIHNSTPINDIQFGSLLSFGEGDWSSMYYNSWADRSDPDWHLWTSQRIANGVSGGHGFIPSPTLPANEVGKQRIGGSVMWAQRFGLANSQFVKVDDAGDPIIDVDPITLDHPFHLPIPDNGNNLWLSYGMLEQWSGTQGVQFRIINDIPQTTANGVDPITFPSGIPGWVFFKNKVLIGTEGTTITDPYGNTSGGNLDLSGSDVSQPLMLAVNGLILAKELLVKTSTPPWPDYVFAPEYKLMPLADLEKSIKINQRLPGIPSAKEIEDGGVNVVTLEAKLLQKVEELTLYVIQLGKENESLKQQLSTLNK